MRRHHAGAAVVLGAALAALIAAPTRDGSLRTVAAGAATNVAATSTQTQTTTSTTSSTTTVVTTTLTESNPAFVGAPPTSAPATSNDLKAALARLTKAGYPATSTTTFKARDTLRVLVGAARSGPSHGERAFFFDLGVYLGTDASGPSEQITVVAQTDTEVDLRYALYHTVHGSTRAVGAQTVRFELEMGHLDTLGHLPSATERR
jgi:hypothetical protein